MKPGLMILAAVSATALVSTPAVAGGLRHKHYCNCGHTSGAATCGSSSSTSTSSTSGGTTTSSGGTSGGSSSTTSSTSSGGTTTSGGTSTSSGGTTSSSGGTAVPEPGVMGMMGLSLVALGIARQRQRRRTA